MDIPLETYKPQILEESFAIAAFRRDHDFAISALTDIPQSAEVEGGYFASFTNVHMIPGEPSPRLRKVEQRNPRLPSEITAFATDLCLEEIKSKQSVLGNNVIRNIARIIGATCEDIDNQTAYSRLPFMTIGVLAIYITEEGEPHAYEHDSRSFAKMFAEQNSEVNQVVARLKEAPGDENTEQALKQAYALQSEHRELGPYEEWKQRNIDMMVETVATAGGIDQDLAMITMGHLVLPSTVTHPTFNKLLFE